MARPAILGPKIYDAVNKLVDDGECESRQKAFAYVLQHKDELGLESMEGKSPGTVAAAYYRRARAIREEGGDSGRNRNRNGNGGGNGNDNSQQRRRKTTSSGSDERSDLDEMADQIQGYVQELVRRAKEGQDVREKLARLAQG